MTRINLPVSEDIEDRLLGILKRKPSIHLQLDIINKCNLRCTICRFGDENSVRDPVKYFKPEEFKAIFEDISPYISQVMLSCAAEPLISKHFSEILSIASNTPHPIDINFCTNAMLMTDHIRHQIIEKGVTNIMISMDGATKSTYERVRVGSKYEQVVSNVMALRDLKESTRSRYPRITLVFVMMKQNIHEAPVFIELAKRLGAESVSYHHLVPTNHIKELGEQLHTSKAMFNYYRDQIIQSGRIHKIPVNLPPPFDINERWKPDKRTSSVDLGDFEDVKPSPQSGSPPIPKSFPHDFNQSDAIFQEFKDTFCQFPFQTIMLSDLNIVLPCSFYRKPLGQLSDGETLSKIFFGNGFKQARRNMYLPEDDPNCVGCPFKSELLPSRSVENRTHNNGISIYKFMHKVYKTGWRILGL